MRIEDRFLQYVSFYTASDEESTASPSTARQKKLAEHLARELREIGVENARTDDYGYVYASIPANTGTSEPALGFISHMDTSPDAPGENVKPNCFTYEGGDIVLSDGHVTAVKEFPFLKKYEGQRLIVTDGTTLLGADDKAGVAEIVSAAEYLLTHPEIPHKTMAICFTPDEEVGRGTEHFDFDAFEAKRAYTIDGGALGEIEYENFNAAAAKIRIKGVNIHPGSAKNKMKNAVLYAAEFVSMLPAAETPAHTEGYEGFYHVQEIRGDENEAVVKLIIRDHDMEKFTARKEFIINLTAYLNGVYGDGTFLAEIRDSYYNMKEKILPHFELVENAQNAFLASGVPPKTVPIRGGTDGAMLSYRGLPCPNLSTGGENFHGVHEFVSVDAMEKMTEVIVRLLTV